MSDDISLPSSIQNRLTIESSGDTVASDTEESRLEKYEEELQCLKTKTLDIEESLEVQNQSQQAIEYDAKDLITSLISALSKKDDTTFLTNYLTVLHTNNTAAIKSVTYDVMSGIEDALRQNASEGSSLGEQSVVLGAFLCTAVLTCTLREPGVRPALRQLLACTTWDERLVLVKTWADILPAAGLIALSDAVRAPLPAHTAPEEPSLSELLLRAALCALDPEQSAPSWKDGAPRLEELNGLVEAWAKRQCADPVSAIALVGRMLAVAPPALRPAFLRRLDAAPPALRADQPGVARLDYKVGVCKLQIMFCAEENVKSLKNNNNLFISKET